MTEQPVTDADQPPVRIERDGIVATVVIDRPKALNALSQHGDDAKVIAGGQSLLPVLRMRLNAPEMVIDLGKIQ